MYRPYGDYAMAIAPYVRQIRDDINKSPEKKAIYRSIDIAKKMGPEYEKKHETSVYQGLLFVLFYEGIFVQQSTKTDSGESLLIMRFATEQDILPPNITNMVKIIQTLNLSILRLFANIVTESSIVVEELEIRPLTSLEKKNLEILMGKHIFFDTWTDSLYRNHIYIDNIICYIDISNKFSPLFRYTWFTDDYHLKHDDKLKDLQQFIKTAHPFDIISTRELTDINKIENELDTYCFIYKSEMLPEIEEIETQTQYITEFIDNRLWKDVYSSIYILSQETIEEQDLEFESYLEEMANDIGGASYTILLIDIFKKEGYPIKDYILEGRELVLNLKDAVEIKLYNILGIKKEKDLQIGKYDDMKKFVEETFPLNKITTEEIDPEYGEIILKDFLKGITITPEPWMFKKIIRNIELEEFKLLLEKVLKENQDAKIYISLTKENIESILETDLLITRLNIKDTGRYIIQTINFNVTITDNFDILLIPLSPTLPVKSTATKRILLDADIEIYKNILRDTILKNPRAIIGDIIFKDTKDLMDIFDNIPIPEILEDIILSYSFYIDILQKDQDIIRELYKTVDLTKFKEDEPILKATIGGLEISEIFYPENLISNLDIHTEIAIFGDEEEYYRILTFHMDKIVKTDNKF